ncbi:Integrase zinc binding domain [Popillia japonica]|uniref:RNA-directed DNA polymerase n=1 Tax=Popillia japonica TaxID=7064 RepID=A0AAW1JHK8_POPJA
MLLSRSYITEHEEGDDPWITEIVHSVSKSLNILDEKKREFKEATLVEPILKKLKHYYYYGWPSDKKAVDDNVKFYFKLQEQIIVEDGLVFLNNRSIVPTSLRQYILKLLHEPHFGIEKTKSRARQAVYWPGLSTSIEDAFSKCSICERYQNSNQKEPLIAHDIPDLPFNKIGCDILEFAAEPSDFKDLERDSGDSEGNCKIPLSTSLADLAIRNDV